MNRLMFLDFKRFLSVRCLELRHYAKPLVENGKECSMWCNEILALERLTCLFSQDMKQHAGKAKLVDLRACKNVFSHV